MKIALGKGDEDSFDQVSFKLSEVKYPLNFIEITLKIEMVE